MRNRHRTTTWTPYGAVFVACLLAAACGMKGELTRPEPAPARAEAVR